jgi:thymidylate synthase
MIKADRYLADTILEILEWGEMDKNPRPKWADGTPAHAKYVTQKVFKYNILRDEFPITTLRTTALKGAFHDIEAIYIKQTNIIEEMHPSIHSWWTDFVVSHAVTPDFKESFSSIGQTYGHTVKRYNLVNKLLDGMATNPFSRRHMINLWQEQQMIEDPQALVPCVYQTNWNIREVDGFREVDLTLHQRSQDFCMTASINPAQYCMFGMIICGHLTWKTGIVHCLANFMHIVENCHIYDRHIEAANEILEREPIIIQPLIRLKVNKNFYDYTWDDFEIFLPEGIKPLSTKLELAI